MIIAIIGLVLMVIAFTVLSILNNILLPSSLFIIGFLLNILGILMINRDIENLILKLEVQSSKPSPEDIRNRPLRKPKK